jgi:hypothetical protein
MDIGVIIISVTGGTAMDTTIAIAAIIAAGTSGVTSGMTTSFDSDRHRSGSTVYDQGSRTPEESLVSNELLMTCHRQMTPLPALKT